MSRQIGRLRQEQRHNSGHQRRRAGSAIEARKVVTRDIPAGPGNVGRKNVYAGSHDGNGGSEVACPIIFSVLACAGLDFVPFVRSAYSNNIQ